MATGIVDIHPHIISKDTRRYPITPLGGKQSVWSAERPIDFENLIASMDEAGVDKAAIVHSSTTYGYDNSYVVDASAPVRPHIEARRVKALAVTTPTRSPSHPELPTVAESGVPGFEAVSLHGVFVPAKTPESISARVNQEIVRVLQRPESRDRLATIGVEPVGSTAAQFVTVMKEEVERMGKVIREAGIEEK